MQSLSAAVTGPREQAVRHGLAIQGRRYEVHTESYSYVLMLELRTRSSVTWCPALSTMLLPA